MAMDLVLKALNKLADPINLRVTRRGDLYTAKRIPDYATLVAQNKVFQVQDTTTTAILVAPPDVTAGLTVQNPASSGKTYLVFSVSGFVDVVPASIGLVTLWQCAHKLPVVPYTRDITLQGTGAGAINGKKAGQGPYGGNIILDRGATVINDGWVATPLEILSNIATTNFIVKEAALIVPVIIPPGAHWSVEGVATVVTFQVGWGLTWAELDDEDLE